MGTVLFYILGLFAFAFGFLGYCGLAQVIIDECVVEEYTVRKTSYGKYVIYGRWGGYSGIVKNFRWNEYPSEKAAEQALKKYIKRKLEEKESKRFSKSLKTSAIRLELELELTEKRMQEILAAQEAIRKEEVKEMQERVRKSKAPLEVQ